MDFSVNERQVIKAMLNRLSFKLRDLFFPVLLNAVQKDKKHKLILKTEKPDIENAIYAISHYSCHDFKYASEVIGKRCWVLVGKQRFDFVSMLGLLLNGIIWVDRKSAKHKKQAAGKVKQLLMKGQNVIIFPEGTWNMSYSLPIMPLYWGIIDIAKETHRPIVPLVLEYEEDKCFVSYGEPMVVSPDDDKKQRIDELRDIMATLKWLIWEEKPIWSRADVTYEMWEKDLNARLSEYPLLDAEYERSIIRKY